MSKQVEIVLMYLMVLAMLLITLSIHEFGHYIFAKKFKVHVKEYSIGIGPTLFHRKTKNNLLISFRLIPLVAYVILDSDSIRSAFIDDVKNKKYQWYMAPTPDGYKSLEQTKMWQYQFIMAGGVIFNFLLFAVLAPFLYLYAWQVNFPNENLWLLNPFVQLGLSLKSIGMNMVFIGDGSIIAQIPTIAGDTRWLFIMFNSLIMMNLITGVLNLVPMPPLDGYKMSARLYKKLKHKDVNEKFEEVLTWIGLALLLYIFITPFINDFIHKAPALLQ